VRVGKGEHQVPAKEEVVMRLEPIQYCERERVFKASNSVTRKTRKRRKKDRRRRRRRYETVAGPGNGKKQCRDKGKRKKRMGI
jgi:hypothetical protein